MAPRIELSNFSNTTQNKLEAQRSFGNDVRQTISSMALGIGEMASRYKSSLLPGSYASTADRLASGFPRFAGGLVTLGFAAYDIYNAFKFDQNSDAQNFPETRKEVFSTSLSVAAGFGAGAIAGGLAAGTAAVGAPFAVIAGIGAVGVIGVGYAASSARDWAQSWWDS